ncbi:hypothetical protein DERF_009807 [Dermatophagoides farinae]|uniref:Uncharacterized protein n=1 Tax=Dermatophagoides farinae TaxID=6954 RepID=A0A922HY12_DERFA|nr:hypothetical protein DERF_009807 [Dermatophagoides farinae]
MSSIKKRKHPIVDDSGDDNDDNDRGENKLIQISKIHAKIRARKLAAGTVDIENDGKSTSKSPKITPPNQRNNILNYFKPKNIDSNAEKQSNEKVIETSTIK